MNKLKIFGVALSGLGMLMTFVADRVKEQYEEDEMNKRIEEQVRRQLADQNKTEGR